MGIPTSNKCGFAGERPAPSWAGSRQPGTARGEAGRGLYCHTADNLGTP